MPIRTPQQVQRRRDLEDKANQLLQFVVRGIVVYAAWHKADPKFVDIRKVHVSHDGTIVVTYGVR